MGKIPRPLPAKRYINVKLSHISFAEMQAPRAPFAPSSHPVLSTQWLEAGRSVSVSDIADAANSLPAAAAFKPPSFL